MERMGNYPAESTLDLIQRQKGLHGIAELVGRHADGIKHEAVRERRTSKESIVTMRSHLNQVHNALLRLEREVITG